MYKQISVRIFVLLGLLFWYNSIVGQEGQKAEANTKEDFKRLDVFPAISYSPETKLTLGAIGIRYFDFDKNQLNTPISNLEFIGVYTLNKPIIAEAKWEFFFGQNLWRSRGEAFFNRYPDRNYGPGNQAAALLVEVRAEGKADTLNYLNFNSDRIKFSPVVLRKIKPNLYLGVQYDMEYLYRMRVTAGNYYYLNADSLEIINLPIDGIRSGLGLQALFDTRSPILNPLQGAMIQLNMLTYHKYLGSDYSFTSLSADLRFFKNTINNQTLGLRIFGSAQLTSEMVPMPALSRVGGHKLIRGYFRGPIRTII
ncbi:MAG: BamA/TamA family outer membrane protein [Saprospiraceae bacterium]|nr:BamA/TamA family outer membrane protein [Saprospiraceae bacterium]